MNLNISTHLGVILEKGEVVRIVAESLEGSFGILPARLDCVACLIPGILIFETRAEGECFVAVDEGILVKKGKDVYVSVKKAMVAPNLEKVQQVVMEQIENLSEEEKKIRTLITKLESKFIINLMKFGHR